MNCSKPTDSMTLFTACSLRLDTNVNRLLLTTCCIHCITMFIVLQPTPYYFTQIQKKFVNSSWLPYTHTQLIMNSITTCSLQLSTKWPVNCSLAPETQSHYTALLTALQPAPTCSSCCICPAWSSSSSSWSLIFDSSSCFAFFRAITYNAPHNM